MSEPYIGEIRAFAFTYNPDQWFPCNGAYLDVSSYTALYSVIGETYGGNVAHTQFAVPNLNQSGATVPAGRAPMGNGKGAGLSYRSMGDAVGGATAYLDIDQIPSHTHSVTGYYGIDLTALTDTPSDAVYLSRTNGQKNFYAAPQASFVADVTMNTTLEASGGSVAHDNMQPYLTVLYCIALSGVYPVRT